MKPAASHRKGYNVGIDIGGTFTDVVLTGSEGNILAKHKVHTTPGQFSTCFVTALERATEGLAPQSLDRILHATTVATNTVLEGKGARTALLMTEGFRDILEIARQRRPALYDLKAEKAKPLVPRRLCFEVHERIGADGAVVTPLLEAELVRVADEVRKADVESVVISFLFSYLNPAHERLLKDHLDPLFPGRVVLSSEIIPEFREFERTSTTVLVGYLRPIFRRYTQKLTGELENRGFSGQQLLIMNSAGGLMSAEAASDRPHTIVESGPAAGVIAAAALAEQLNEPNVISFDMGGTTAKASLIENASYRTTTEYEIGGGIHRSLSMQFTGYPIKAPMIDLTECSAGGGSIASVDGLGVLKVGPRSAGADPGPVCYGKGGTDPTVTDANVVLGRINPDFFIGGQAELDRDRAFAAIRDKIARPLGLSVNAAAEGIVTVVNAQMSRILRVVSIARGLDPRHFSLVAFGGAGPLHAADLAAELGIPKVVIPEAPGLFSALGLLQADRRADFSATSGHTVTAANAETIQHTLDRLEGEAAAWLGRETVPVRRRVLIRSADMRYPLQNYEINVTLPAGSVSDAWIKRAQTAFHDAHERLYGYSDRTEQVQVVNLRVAGIGRTMRPSPKPIEKTDGDVRVALKDVRPVRFQGVTKSLSCPIYDRELLRAGDFVAGPAIVEQPDSNVLVPPSVSMAVDDYGRLVMGPGVKGPMKSRGRKMNG